MYNNFPILLCIGLLCGCGAQEKGVCYVAVERSDFQNQVKPACKLTFTDAYGIPTVLEVFEGYVRLKQLGVESMVVQVDAQACKAILAEVS